MKKRMKNLNSDFEHVYVGEKSHMKMWNDSSRVTPVEALHGMSSRWHSLDIFFVIILTSSQNKIEEATVFGWKYKLLMANQSRAASLRHKIIWVGGSAWWASHQHGKSHQKANNQLSCWCRARFAICSTMVMIWNEDLKLYLLSFPHKICLLVFLCRLERRRTSIDRAA